MKFAQYINENSEDKEFAKLLISKLYEINSDGEIAFKGSEFNRSYNNPVALTLTYNPKYGKFLEESGKIYMIHLKDKPKLKAKVQDITGENMNIMYFAVTNWGIVLMDRDADEMGTFEVDKKFFIAEVKKEIKLIEKSIVEFQKSKEKGNKIALFKPRVGKALKVFESKPLWMTDWTSKPRIMTVDELTQENMDLIKRLSRNKTIKAAEEAVKEFCLAKGFNLAQGENYITKDSNRDSFSHGRQYDNTISYGVYINEIDEDDLYTLMHIINVIKNKNDKVLTIQTHEFYGIRAQ